MEINKVYLVQIYNIKEYKIDGTNKWERDFPSIISYNTAGVFKDEKGAQDLMHEMANYYINNDDFFAGGYHIGSINSDMCILESSHGSEYNYYEDEGMTTRVLKYIAVEEYKVK